MSKSTGVKKSFFIKDDYFLPSLSIDCVIFGFHEGELKVLLNKFAELPQWMLPGGFVRLDEDVNNAAYRVLEERTGLKKLFLEQFYLFGDCSRSTMELKASHAKLFESKLGSENHWFMQRFVSVGYYALVDFSKVKLGTDNINDKSGWFYIKDIPQLCYDHNRIIEKAIASIRMRLGSIPLGLELLPEKFLMSDLRVLYETLLGWPLDRRNFQRSMLAQGIIKQLDELYTEGAFKPAYLYSFDRKKYAELIARGLPLNM